MTGNGPEYLPYGRQYIDEDDIQAVVDILRSDWLTTGPTGDKFDHKLRDVTGSDFAVSCSSGTAALHLACMALGLGPGDRVIVPAISFVATANAALYCGADILFSDVDPECGLMRPQDITDLLAGLSADEVASIAAIIPVNLTGEVVAIAAIDDIARAHGWKIIIDSCHALGTSYRDQKGHDRRVGDCHYADIEVFSFHAVKTIAMGEGGAVTTNDQELYHRLRLLRNHGIEKNPDNWLEYTGKTPAPWYYQMQYLGYNYRLSDIHAALGLSQLNKLASFSDRRRQRVAQYDALFARLCPDIRPIKKTPGCTATRHLYVVLIDFAALGITRSDFVGQLAARNIGTQVHYIPIHTQPFYADKYGRLTRPGAESYYARALSLPLHVSMTAADVIYVVEQISAIVKGGL
ncbi:MAG: UDP-4-amino-4,6-dideoxy-N-acetyl-beta-L-altrosamine transaminase [Alphaproteobacteria bacterium]|nr:UDP-4-amino-4,6-dideoxy-N-acetyl-beta-L-altrosamine transaminase [Alphaproteobacteria bacterium]